MWLTFTTYGSPIAMPRTKARAIVNKQGRAFAHIYNPPGKSRQWKTDVKWAAKAAMSKNNSKLWDGPIYLMVEFYLPRPKSLYKKKDFEGPILHVVKPDIDNLIRAIEDSLTGIVIHDDRQVCRLMVSKWYHEKNQGPRATITVEEL